MSEAMYASPEVVELKMFQVVDLAVGRFVLRDECSDAELLERLVYYCVLLPQRQRAGRRKVSCSLS